MGAFERLDSVISDAQLRAVEGRQVIVALTAGTSLQDCRRVSAGRLWARSVLLLSGDTDLFNRPNDIADVAVFEARGGGVSTTEPAAQQVIDEVMAAPGNVLRATDALTEAVNDRNAWRCATPSSASAGLDSKRSAWSVRAPSLSRSAQ
jgi:hypothetical protein